MKLNPNYILNEVGGEFMLVYTGRDVARLNTVFSMNEATAYTWDYMEKILMFDF